jgi:hypothetical protein
VLDPAGRDGAALARLRQHSEVIDVIRLHEATIRVEERKIRMTKLAHVQSGASMSHVAGVAMRKRNDAV